MRLDQTVLLVQSVLSELFWNSDAPGLHHDFNFLIFGKENELPGSLRLMLPFFYSSFEFELGFGIVVLVLSVPFFSFLLFLHSRVTLDLSLRTTTFSRLQPRTCQHDNTLRSSTYFYYVVFWSESSKTDCIFLRVVLRVIRRVRRTPVFVSNMSTILLLTALDVRAPIFLKVSKFRKSSTS